MLASNQIAIKYLVLIVHLVQLLVSNYDRKFQLTSFAMIQYLFLLCTEIVFKKLKEDGSEIEDIKKNICLFF